MIRKGLKRKPLITACITLLFGAVLLAPGCAGSRTSPVDKQYQRIMEQQQLKSEALDEVESREKPASVDDPKVSEQKGDNYLRTGNYGMAFIEYKKALDADPGQVRVRLKLANLLLKRKMWADALKQFETIEKRSPQNVVALQGKGAALIQLDRPAEAERALKMAVDIDTGLWQAYALLGSLYDRQKLYAPAVEAYEKAIAINPKKVALYNNLGTSLFKAGKYRESADILLKAIRLNAFNSETYNALGFALFKMEMFREAYEAFKKGGDEASAYNNMGVLFMEAGDYARSIEFFEKAINAKPAYYEAAYVGLQKAKAALKPESSGLEGGKDK